MDNIKTDDYYLNLIEKDLDFINNHMLKIEKEEFCKNELLIDSMMFRMIQISENAKKVSNVFKEQNEEIPWNAISGLRNRIVHDYGNVSLDIVFDTLKNDIPELYEVMFEEIENEQTQEQSI